MPAGLIVLLVAVVAAAVVSVDRAGRLQNVEELHAAWTSLAHCLLGTDPLAVGEDPAERMRHEELAILTGHDAPEARRRRHVWLRSCGAHAAGVVAILSRDSMHKAGRYDTMRELASAARGALGRSELPDAEVIDGLVKEATELELEHRPMSAVARQRDVHRPLLHEAQPAVLAPGGARLLADDDVPGRAARLLLEVPGGGRRACLFPRSENPEDELGSYTCLDLPAPTGLAARPLRELRSTFAWVGREAMLITGDGQRALVERVNEGGVQALGFVEGEVEGGLVASGGEHLIVTERDGVRRSLSVSGATLVREGSLSLVPRSAHWVVPVPGALLWGMQLAPQRDVLQSATFEAALSGKGVVESRGVVPESASVASCRAGDATVVLVEGRTARPAVTHERKAVFLFHDGTTWAPAVPTDASWSSNVVAGLASYRTPLLTCAQKEAVVTWSDPESPARISQLRCTRFGCQQTSTFLAHEPLHQVLLADFGGKVVLVWNDTTHRIVRMRAAPLGQLGEARDVVLHDDAERGRATSVTASEPVHLLVREHALLVVLRIARGEGGQLVAIRFDADHEPTFPVAR